MQSPCNGFPPTTMCLATRLQTLWQSKAQQRSKWRHEHPQHNKADFYYLLTRQEQATVFRLRPGQNRLNYHLYSKLHIGHSEQCPCGTGSQTTEHLLQSCLIYEPLRKGIWPDHTPRPAMHCPFIEETGVSIWRMRRRSFIMRKVTFSFISRSYSIVLRKTHECAQSHL